jgi:hypothetical protein
VTPSTDGAGQTSDCRAERAGQVSWYRWLPAIVFVLFVGGFWAAAFYIKHIPVADRFDDVEVEFGLWVALIGALGGFALAACLCFVTWLVGLVRLFDRVRAATVISWVVSVLVVDAILFATLFFSGEGAAASVGKTLTRQTRPVVIALGLCMAPGLIALLALRSVATEESNWLEPGACRLRLLIRLRRELRTILATLGAFLTLLVITTGMRRRALDALMTDPAIPPEQVLLYGLVFAVLLGLFYVAANSSLDNRSQRFIDEFASLPDPADEAISDRVRKRKDLAELVGSGGSWRSFETVVVIAAPLLTALIGSAIGK